MGEVTSGLEADPLDLVIVGAGPCGLAAAVAAKESGLSHIVVDRGCITESLTHYPYYMTFFSTAERLEIGGVPLRFRSRSRHGGRRWRTIGMWLRTTG